MNVLQNMITFYNHLPPDSTYKNVCGTILSNLQEASKGTIYELAEITNSSRTTIWRMIQKIGYHSFSEFHHELKQAFEQYTYYNRILPAELSSSAENAKEAIFHQSEEAVRIFKNTVSLQEINNTAQKLVKADKIRFYIPFQSSSIYSFQQNLGMAGIETAYYSLMPEMLKDCQNLTSNSIVFVSTIHHVEAMDLSEVFENICKQKATILGIQNKNTRYQKYISYEVVESQSTEVLQNIMIFEMYFYLLSEIFRINYLQ